MGWHQLERARKARDVGRKGSRGNENLNLTVARVSDEKEVIPSRQGLNMDSELWKGMPEQLVYKILLQHLLLDLPDLARGSRQATTYLAQSKTCAMLVGQNPIFHQFGGPKQQLPQGSRLLALSPHGLLFVLCENSGPVQARVVVYNLVDGQKSDLGWDLECWYVQPPAIDAGQVIHPHPSEPDDYKLVILHSSCSGVSVYDSRCRSWSKVLRPSRLNSDKMTIVNSAIVSWKTNVDATIPRHLYCETPIPTMATEEQLYGLILATLGTKPGNNKWARGPEWEEEIKEERKRKEHRILPKWAHHYPTQSPEAAGIHEQSPVIIGAVSLNLRSGNWELVPGPSRKSCERIVKAELRCVGFVKDCLVVFADQHGHLLSCLAEPWSWWHSTPVVSWSTKDSGIVHTVFTDSSEKKERLID